MRRAGSAVSRGAVVGRPFDKEVTLYIGGVHASADATLIKTLLGSCIAVCLYDPVAQVGGMNHFMLPHGGADGLDPTRFGVHAMDTLIGAVIKVGGDRRRLVAKVFGGAHVLDIQGSGAAVPQQNIEFVHEFLARDGFVIVGEDVGGCQPRHVHFYSRSGRALVKKVASPAARERVLRQEQMRAAEPAPGYGAVVLFD